MVACVVSGNWGWFMDACVVSGDQGYNYTMALSVITLQQICFVA